MKREDLTVGMPVKVHEDRRPTVDGVVTKIARTWVTIKSEPYGYESKYKIDSQSEETGYGYGGAYFRSLEQEAENARRVDAQTTIKNGLLNSYGGLDSRLPLDLLEEVAEVVTRWHDGEELLEEK